MNKKIIGIVLLVAGVAAIVWGYNQSQTVGGQITEAFSGSPSDEILIYYIGGAVAALIGIFILLKR
jgi:drug/metabolite transporter (DMT)-like permease